MALFEWKSEYSVNVKVLDAQHKKLVEMINDLYRALLSSAQPNIMEDILDRMIAYSVNHFETEEHYMEMFDYHLYQQHKKQHELFIQKIVEYLKQQKAGELKLSAEPTKFLKEWLMDHILKNDKRYTEHFNQAGLT